MSTMTIDDLRTILVEVKVNNAPEAYAAIAEVAGVSATEVAVLSNAPPCRHAARDPIHSPSSTASTVAVPTSSTVGPIRSTMSSPTGRL